MPTICQLESFIVIRKIALFGGTFDPPTLGHQFVAQAVYAETDVDEVWFMPCYGHQLDKKPIAAPWDRWQMCQLLSESMGPNFSVCDYEIRTKSDGKLYETLKFLEKELKENYELDFQLCPVIGSDCANDVKNKWFEGEKLTTEYQFIVVNRGGVPINCDWIPHKLINLSWQCSSTDFREIFKTDRYLARRKINYKLWGSLNRIYK